MPQVPIIEHSDIKRMLLFQRAVVEGSLSLIIQCSRYADLAKVLTGIEKDTNHLIGLSSSHGPERFIADASIYLEYFGVITIAWQWLLQGTAALHALNENASGADFYRAKIYTCRFFFEYELHRSLYLSTTLMNSSGLTNEDKELLFNE